MKVTRYLLLFLVFGIFMLMGTSCRVYHAHRFPKGQIITSKPYGKVPPGQMKKMTGAKSAKAYAPGQQKKHKWK